MSADGNWKITISTPMGPQVVDTTIATSGDTFTGEARSQLGNDPISGQVDGDALRWTMKINKPMPMTLEFDVKIDGDNMNGRVKLGPFGPANLTGVRA